MGWLDGIDSGPRSRPGYRSGCLARDKEPERSWRVWHGVRRKTASRLYGSRGCGFFFFFFFFFLSRNKTRSSDSSFDYKLPCATKKSGGGGRPPGTPYPG